MSTDLSVIEQEDALSAFATIGIGMEAAGHLAFRLNDIIKQQKLSKRIGQKDHIFVEAWCACASMCGLSPRTEWCRRITDAQGAVVGYEARVEVVRLNTGEVIGAAETECWLDEKSGGRVRWTEKHAAKSMAQTRGTSKAIAQVLRWIPILAGYSGTPAEEADTENGMPEMHPQAPSDPHAPKSQPRGDRIEKAEVDAVGSRWKVGQPEDKRTFQDWNDFVEAATGKEWGTDAKGRFVVGIWTAWTPRDVAMVDAKVRERDAAYQQEADVPF